MMLAKILISAKIYFETKSTYDRAFHISKPLSMHIISLGRQRTLVCGPVTNSYQQQTRLARFSVAPHTREKQADSGLSSSHARHASTNLPSNETQKN